MKRVALLSAMIFMAFVLSSQQTYQDCSEAYFICSNDPISIAELPANFGGSGFLESNCMMEDIPTSNSIWFKWKVKSSGSFGFSILPVEEADDFDFVLYKMTNGLEDCDQKEAIRCMASGENRGGTEINTANECSGVTGLSDSSEDISESVGCAGSDDNFLKEVQLEEGEEYALWVNNYYSTNGFILEFTGEFNFDHLTEYCEKGIDTTGGAVLNGVLDEKLIIYPLYPNPANSKMTLPIISEQTYNDGLIQVIGLHGDVLKTNKLSVVSGSNDIPIGIEFLPKGTYFLKIILDDNIYVARFGKF